LNAAARLVFSTRRSEHIIPLLRELRNWLKVPERIQFRLCVLTHRCLHGTAPPYHAELRHFSRRLIYKDVVVSGLFRRRHSSYHRHIEPPLVIVRFRLLRRGPGFLSTSVREIQSTGQSSQLPLVAIILHILSTMFYAFEEITLAIVSP